MTGTLNEAEILRYRDQGCLCPLDVLSADEAAEHRAALEAIEQRYAEGGLPRPIAHYLRIGAHLAMDLPLRLARDPRILGRVESILGPDIALWGGEYFVKEAGATKIVSWHQDLTYWGMEGSDHEVTAWLALSPATRQSGCMKFLPGSHKQCLQPHVDTFAEDNLLSRGQEVAVEVDERQAFHAELQPGQMSLHHGRLFHASGPNESGDRRIGLVLRFIRPDTPVQDKGRDFAVLLSGIDRVQNRINVAPPAGALTAAHLALYDEVLAAQSATLGAGLEDPGQLYQGNDNVIHQ